MRSGVRKNRVNLNDSDSLRPSSNVTTNRTESTPMSANVSRCTSTSGMQIPPSPVRAEEPQPSDAFPEVAIQMCAPMCEPRSSSLDIPRNFGPEPCVYGSEGWGFESLRAHTVLRQKWKKVPIIGTFFR